MERWREVGSDGGKRPVILGQWASRLRHARLRRKAEGELRGPDTVSLRKRCAQRLQELDLPRSFDLEALCDRVAATRGRTLRLLPLPNLGASAPCGLWIAVEQTDYVFYEAGTSQLHADHIVLHELCHIICGHTDEQGIARKVTMSRLMPNLNLDMVLAVLGRVKYSTDQEREAELLASLIRAVGLDIAPQIADGPGHSLAVAVEEALNPTSGGTFR